MAALAAAMRRMYEALGCSVAIATGLMDDEGLDSCEELIKRDTRAMSTRHVRPAATLEKVKKITRFLTVLCNASHNRYFIAV